MKKFLLVLLFPALLFGGKSNVQYDSVDHKIQKPPTTPSTTADYDFTGLNVIGLAVTGGGGGGTPGGADRQLQFNNAFTFGGVPYATYDGSAVTFRTGARFILADPTDATKRVQIALANPTATLKTLTISDNSVTVIPSSVTPNQFMTNVNTLGVAVTAQPLFSNLGGTLSLTQTSMSTNKLLGRGTAGTGAIEEITLGTNLTLTGTTLDATGGGGGTPGGSTTQFQYNNAGAFGGQNSLIFSGGFVQARDTTFRLFSNSDPTATANFRVDSSSGTNETVIIPNSSNPVVVAGASAVASQWVRYIDNLGVQQRSQPTYSDLGGSPTLAQQSIPVAKERFVDPTNGSDITGAENIARPFLTLAGAALTATNGTVIYTYPNITGYDQGTTPFVIPAGVTIVGAGADTTLIKGAVTGVTRAVVEPSTSSAIYNVTIQNTSSTGVAFGVGSSSTAFTSAYLGGSKIIANAQGIYINKAGTTGLVIENTSVSTQNDCLFQNVSTAVTETRNCDFIADGTTTLTESKGLNVMNGTIRFNYGSITVGGATGTNVGAFCSGATSTIELHGVRIANSGGGATNYDVQSQSSATVGVAGVFRSDAAALVTNGTITELSRYAVRDNNLTDFPNIGAGTRGDIIFRGATGWQKLIAGLDGNVLTTHGNTADPDWSTVSGAGGIVNDNVYGSGWNGITTTAPSENVIYDYLHLMDTDDDGKINVLDQVAGIVNTNATGIIQTPLAAPTGAIVGDTDIQNISNKRITKRALSLNVPGASPTINTDNYDLVHLYNIAGALNMTNNLSGTPVEGDTLRMDFTDGVGHTINWGASYEPSPGQILPTATTAGERMDVGFAWNTATGKWRCLASSNAIAVGGTGTVTSVGATGLNGISIAGTNPVTTSGTIVLGLPITLAGTAGKTLTVNNSITLAGTDGVTLNVGTTGGTLGSNAFTSTTFLTASAISDAVWSSAMNGDTTTASSRNTIYDWGHTFDTNDNGKVDVLDIGAGIPKTDASGNVTLATAGTDYADLAFRTIAVSGQSNVVADSASDTLTLAAGSNVTITTTAGTDTVTIAATGGGGTSATKQDVGDADATIVSPVTVINLTTALTAPRVLTLPAASDYGPLTPLVISDPVAVENSTNTISLARAGSDTINGGTSNVVVLGANEAGGSVNILSDGVNKWTTISKGGGSRMTGYVDGTTPTSGKILKADGTRFKASTETYAAPGTSGNVLTSDGTNWTSAAPAAGGVTSITGTSPIVVSPTTGAAVASLNTAVDAAWTVPQTISAGNVSTGLTISMNDAVNNDATPQLTLDHNYNAGAGTTAMGSEILFQAEDSTTASQIQASIESGWTDATHATRTANLDIRLVNNASALTNVKARFFGSGGFSVNSLTDPGAGYINAGTGFKINNVALAASDVGAQPADSDLTTWAGITPGTGVGTALAVNVGTAGAFVTNGGALGTPSSGTLTNATGLPVAGITASTSTALGVGSIELGHATDTTIARVSSGVISVEGVTVDTISATNTLTNKRINPRVTTITSNATWSPSADTDDEYNITAQAAAVTTISNPSGTPVEGQRLMIRVKDDGTARAISGWGSNYRFSSDMAAPTTTVLGKGMYLLFIYTTAGSVTKWDNVAQMNNF